MKFAKHCQNSFFVIDHRYCAWWKLHIPDKYENPLQWDRDSFLKKFWGHQSFLWGHLFDAPVLDFWWCLPSFLRFTSVQHLLNLWRTAWQVSLFSPHTCIQVHGNNFKRIKLSQLKLMKIHTWPFFNELHPWNYYVPIYVLTYYDMNMNSKLIAIENVI